MFVNSGYGFECDAGATEATSNLNFNR